MTEIITGILTDYALQDEGAFTGYYGARIDDKPYVVLHHVDSFLLRLQKGQWVEISLNKDGHISKIVPRKAAQPSQNPAAPDAEKLKKNGFGQPTPGPAPAAQPQKDVAPARAPDELFTDEEVAAMKAKAAATQAEKAKNAAQGGASSCTSPVPPANAPAPAPEKVSINGVIQTIDLSKRTLAVEDKDGIVHLARWVAGTALDEYFRNQKQGYGETLTGVVKDDVMDLTGAKFWDKVGMPQKSKGWGGGKPRNEKPMAYESAFKSCADLIRDTDFPGMPYADRVEEVRKAAEKVAKWIVTEGGA